MLFYGYLLFNNCGIIDKVYGINFEFSFICVEYVFDIVRGVIGKNLICIYIFLSYWNIKYIYYKRCIYYEVIEI